MESIDQLSSLIKSDPNKALEIMYSEYYSMLCNKVNVILKDRVATEDIVQEVFYEVWKKKDILVVQTSMSAYLSRACRNRTLNYIRDNKVKWEDESLLENQLDTGFTSEEYLNAEDLNIEIQNIISEMPEKCGIVFSLSRYEDMSYADISAELKISVKTVESQISKALRILRKKIYKKSDEQ